MPPRKNARKNASPATAAAAGGHDNINSLPDGVLEHMLSFLPALDAVRTCVLAKRWRHLWKSTPVLRFACGGTDQGNSSPDFVDQLLQLRIRGSAPLDACEFCVDVDGFFDTDADVDVTSLLIDWIDTALECKVRVLQLSYVGDCFLGIPYADGHPFFVSQYLKKLELYGLYFMSRFLDFSCCPVLEELEFLHCCLGSDSPIFSQSLKRLSIARCYFPRLGSKHMSICARNLVSLWLEVCGGRTPSLQTMPSLQTAVVKILGYDLVPLHSDNENNQSILLQSLSEVRNLVLMSPDTEMFIFRRNLKFCSSFNKLKSLLLDEYWCVPADFSALACLLKLSPVLEKLTLQLYSKGPNHKMEIKLSCKPMDISTEISQHLKTLEVNCEVYDHRVRNVLTFLSKKLNIWFQFSG